MARKSGEPISKWAIAIWVLTGAALLGCGLAQLGWRNDNQKNADIAIAFVVFVGTMSGAVGASTPEWKSSRNGGPDGERSARIRDRLSLFGWGLMAVGATCTLARLTFLP